MLLIRDGWGVREDREFNAPLLANTPVHDKLFETYPCTLIEASGLCVGLPEGVMGNSEVGHLNLGAGRTVLQEVVLINRSIEDGSFFSNDALLGAMRYAKENGSCLHLFGLVSDGLVHSSLEHLAAILTLAKREGLGRVFIHCFMDGRDTPPHSGIGYIRDVEKMIKEAGAGRIASVMGRYYAMDRDKRWHRLEKAYRALVLGEGNRARSAAEAMEKSYAENITDEFVLPAVIEDEGGAPVAVVKREDAVIFFNFRADRARELCAAFFEEDFPHFERPAGLFPHIATLTQYDDDFPFACAFKPRRLDNILTHVLADAGMTQLRIAETEKYAHVTYFFSGGEEEAVKGEDRRLIPSPKVATYDLKPEMSAFEVKDEVVRKIKNGGYDFIALNFANPDMVGHTGNLDAAVMACEVVDGCVGEVLAALEAARGAALITADHGNCELMQHASGEPHTQHTTSPVHCVLFDPSRRNANIRPGILADVAPTLLEMMNLSKPSEMTGSSLIV
jgi:2,3-bisphosphoglycerate-independent phosphoglycerate mutase